MKTDGRMNGMVGSVNGSPCKKPFRQKDRQPVPAHFANAKAGTTSRHYVAKTRFAPIKSSTRADDGHMSVRDPRSPPAFAFRADGGPGKDLRVSRPTSNVNREL